MQTSEHTHAWTHLTLIQDIASTDRGWRTNHMLHPNPKTRTSQSYATSKRGCRESSSPTSLPDLSEPYPQISPGHTRLKVCCSDLPCMGNQETKTRCENSPEQHLGSPLKGEARHG